MKKNIKYTLIIISGIVIEFSRDYCFININLQIEYLENLTNNLEVLNYTDSRIYIFLKGLKITPLKNLKWILSLIYFSLNFLIGLLFSKLIFSPSNYRQFLKMFLNGGGIILIISITIYILGKLFDLETEINFYFIALELSHFVQSLLYPISFLLVFWSSIKDLNKLD